MLPHIMKDIITQQIHSSDDPSNNHVLHIVICNHLLRAITTNTISFFNERLLYLLKCWHTAFLVSVIKSLPQHSKWIVPVWLHRDISECVYNATTAKFPNSKLINTIIYNIYSLYFIFSKKFLHSVDNNKLFN
jgi:hypothetical protein